MNDFLVQLGSPVRERPAPTLLGAVAAAGAALVVLGLAAVALDSYEGDTHPVGIALGALAVAGGYVVVSRLSAWLRPAGVTLIALGILLVVAFAFNDVEEPTAPLFVLALAYAAAWALGPARGAATFLTLSLLAVWALMIDVASGGGDTSGFSIGGVDAPDSALTPGDDTVAYLSLVLGALLLLAVRILDRDGWHGIATSAVIVGDIAFVTGVFGVIGTFESDGLGALLVLAAGITLAVVGAGGDRRFTTWLGGIGVFVGVVALIVTGVDVDDAVQFGLLSLLVGVAMIAGAAMWAQDRPEPGTEAEAISLPETISLPEVFSTPASHPPTTPDWYPDPRGRHELRWHDGAEWTDHVADGGATGRDLDGD